MLLREYGGIISEQFNFGMATALAILIVLRPSHTASDQKRSGNNQGRAICLQSLYRSGRHIDTPVHRAALLLGREWT